MYHFAWAHTVWLAKMHYNCYKYFKSKLLAWESVLKKISVRIHMD